MFGSDSTSYRLQNAPRVLKRPQLLPLAVPVLCVWLLAAVFYASSLQQTYLEQSKSSGAGSQEEFVLLLTSAQLWMGVVVCFCYFVVRYLLVQPAMNRFCSSSSSASSTSTSVGSLSDFFIAFWGEVSHPVMILGGALFGTAALLLNEFILASDNIYNGDKAGSSVARQALRVMQFTAAMDPQMCVLLLFGGVWIIGRGNGGNAKESPIALIGKEVLAPLPLVLAVLTTLGSLIISESYLQEAALASGHTHRLSFGAFSISTGLLVGLGSCLLYQARNIVYATLMAKSRGVMDISGGSGEDNGASGWAKMHDGSGCQSQRGYSGVRNVEEDAADWDNSSFAQSSSEGEEIGEASLMRHGQSPSQLKKTAKHPSMNSVDSTISANSVLSAKPFLADIEEWPEQLPTRKNSTIRRRSQYQNVLKSIAVAAERFLVLCFPAFLCVSFYQFYITSGSPGRALDMPFRSYSTAGLSFLAMHCSAFCALAVTSLLTHTLFHSLLKVLMVLVMHLSTFASTNGSNAIHQKGDDVGIGFPGMLYAGFTLLLCSCLVSVISRSVRYKQSRAKESSSDKGQAKALFIFIGALFLGFAICILSGPRRTGDSGTISSASLTGDSGTISSASLGLPLDSTSASEVAKVHASCRGWTEEWKMEVFTSEVDNFVSTHLIKKGVWEEELTRQLCLNNVLQQCLHARNSGVPAAKRPLVADIGANVGYHGFTAAAFGCRVVMFEMQKQVVLMLKNTIAMNKGFNELITVVHGAISEQAGEMSYTSLEGNIGGTEMSTEGNEKVKTLRVDDYVKEHTLFTKLDIEGSEWQAIVTGNDYFAKLRTDLAIVELRKNQQDVLEWFYDHGYKWISKSREQSKFKAISELQSLKNNSYTDFVFRNGDISRKVDNGRTRPIIAKANCGEHHEAWEMEVFNPNVDKYVSAHLIKYGNWESSITETLCENKVLRKCMDARQWGVAPSQRPLVADIGSNVGYHGFTAAAYGCRVVMFEMQKEVVNMLERTVAANKAFSDLITIVHGAISEEPGEMSYTSLEGNIGGTELTTKGNEKVKTVRVDEYVNEHTLFTKLDVEGSEWQAIATGTNYFGKLKTDLAIVELRGNQEDVFKWFYENDYKWFDNGNEQSLESGLSRLQSMNGRKKSSYADFEFRLATKTVGQENNKSTNEKAGESSRHQSVIANATCGNVTKSWNMHVFTAAVDNYVSAHLINYGNWEPELTKQLCSNNVLKKCLDAKNAGVPLAERPLVADIGANVGYHGFTSAAFGCRVVMFEMQKEVVGMLKETIALNEDFPQLIQVVHGAISEQPGEMSYTSLEGNIGGTEMTAEGNEKVQTLRIDDHIKEHTVFTKLDIEGSEWQAIATGNNYFGKLKTELAIVELRGSQKDVMKWLYANGYKWFENDQEQSLESALDRLKSMEGRKKESYADFQFRAVAQASGDEGKGMDDRQSRHQSIVANATCGNVTKSWNMHVFTAAVDNYVSAHLINYGNWEPELTKQLCSNNVLKKCLDAKNAGVPLAERPLVADIGANVGYHGFTSAAFGCRVVMFEMQKEVVGMLKETIALNEDFPQLIQVVHGAISEQPGEMSYTSLEGNIGGTEMTAEGNEKVQTLRIDDHIKEHTVFTKLDIEGSEWQAIATGNNYFGKLKTELAIVELRGGQVNVMKWLYNHNYAWIENGTVRNMDTALAALKKLKNDRYRDFTFIQKH
eukprot:Nk52_evm5s2103 gene=Nk52_evmTU5s2103